MTDEISDIWRAHHKSKERLDEVCHVVMGIDGSNGLRSKVANHEERLHAIEDKPLKEAGEREAKIKKWAVAIGSTAIGSVLLLYAQDIVKAVFSAVGGSK